MSDHDDRRTPARGDDTFDDLFPSDEDETRAMQQSSRGASPASPPMQEYDGELGSPPPPRGGTAALPWIIIAASVLAIAVVGFMILRGQRTTPNLAQSSPAVTRTVTATSSPGSSTSASSPSSPSSSSSIPLAATTPPPGFQKCAGTSTGYRVAGAGTTCPFVADVATQAAAGAATASGGSFTIQVTSASTKQSYALRCVVQAYIQCTIPATGGKSSPTYIDVLRS